VSEAAERCVDAVGRILSNYQAALLMLEEADPEVLRQAASEVFAPVLDACAGVAPGLEELVAEAIGSGAEPVAAAHSRLIRRRPRLVKAAESRALVAAARRLDELAAGSHSAGALFALVSDRLRAGRP
jgi:hypothetical protein